MVKIFGEYYYIDFEELDVFLTFENNDGVIETNKVVTKTDKNDETISNVFTKEEHVKHKEINGVKFELIRGFIADLGDEPSEVEDDLMLAFKSLETTSIRFKLAFNTLLAYDILKKMK